MFGLETEVLVGGAVLLAFVVFLGWKMFGPKKDSTGTGGGGFSGGGGKNTKIK